MKKIELLAPAGNLEKAKTAILYGADAVYIGGKSFSLRSRASNFSLEEIGELVEFANAHSAPRTSNETEADAKEAIEERLKIPIETKGNNRISAFEMIAVRLSENFSFGININKNKTVQ